MASESSPPSGSPERGSAPTFTANQTAATGAVSSGTPAAGAGTVTQNWVTTLPWKMQSVLFSGLRGPDTHHCPRLKQVTRWLRRVTQHDADPRHSYMAPEHMPTGSEIEKEFEFTSVHFASHFLYALEIIAYKHPEAEARAVASGYYVWLCREALHLEPESEAAMDQRLRGAA